MKIPAIRAQIGIWVYYVATLSFKQIADNVRKVDNELHKSEVLSDMLQRSITDNYKRIANYICQQDERFFNSIVLAVYDGDPQWNEVRLEYEDGEDFYDLGLLELNGKEKIFPVDGQHRVEGIKQVVKTSDKYHNEKIPVIFIGHNKDEEGMQRARRMFSTLNRYAKPVSLRDIIVLDEDDSIAIACREMIENNNFFSGRILDSKNKSLSEKNDAFSNIITFYECNKELLRYFIRDKVIKNSEDKKVNGSSKLNEYIKSRPTDEDVNSFIDFCNNYWNNFINSFDDLRKYSAQENSKSSKFRNKNGGSILFRPTSLISIVKSSIILMDKKNLTDKNAFGKISVLQLQLESKMWENILWNPVRKIMITTNKKTVELLILYCADKSVLSKSEVVKLKTDLMGILQTSATEIEKYLKKYSKT